MPASCFIGRNTVSARLPTTGCDNMYHKYECGAWYSSVYMDGETSEWCLSSNKRGRITSVQVGGHDSWVMYGPAFLSRDFSNQLIPLIEEAYHQPGDRTMVLGTGCRRSYQRTGFFDELPAGGSGL
ncbi:MAG: hypothetical protein ACLR8P_10825 [Clostridium fessum]